MSCWATYEILSPTVAIVEINYSATTFGLEKVTVNAGFSLYEAAYSAASVKAAMQGLRLERFARV